MAGGRGRGARVGCAWEARARGGRAAGGSAPGWQDALGGWWSGMGRRWEFRNTQRGLPVRSPPVAPRCYGGTWIPAKAGMTVETIGLRIGESAGSGSDAEQDYLEQPARMSRHGGGGQRHTTAGAAGHSQRQRGLATPWTRRGVGCDPAPWAWARHWTGCGPAPWAWTRRRVGCDPAPWAWARHWTGCGPTPAATAARPRHRTRPARRCQGSPAGRCPALQDGLASATPVRGCISDRGGGKTTGADAAETAGW